VDFRELLEELAREKVNAVLVAGWAVAFHGRPRATKDMDLLLDGAAENLQRAARPQIGQCVRFADALGLSARAIGQERPVWGRIRCDLDCTFRRGPPPG